MPDPSAPSRQGATTAERANGAVNIGEGPVPHLYPPAVRAGDFVFVSGHACVDESGAYDPRPFAEEMTFAMGKVAQALALAGSGMDDVVQVRAYLGDPRHKDEYNALFPTFFARPGAARTTIQHCLGEIKFEVDVVAYSPRREPPDPS
ncbi:RidA family protein [Nocardioides sp. L-11A]|uniref:RidA family protein n=1 Tax=Nocardioides sp. L-11A TaxID=3043848 RepID=UPI00249C6456|nr:RidA family protein [Nocardioides sp. L-11A]